MSNKIQVLKRLADAISDGEEIDWELEIDNNSELGGKLRSLRAIDAIARVYRESAPVTSGEAVGPTIDLDQDSASPPDGWPTSSISRWGLLELREKIGEGAFGEVYRAWDPTLQREVALKLLRAERSNSEADTTRFIDEARKLARVRHPNVLVVYGADRHQGRVGLWTELLEGKTLEDCLRSDGPFAAHEASAIGLDLCHALAAVHNAGLVHRDVKPVNVIRERGGRTVLLDFSVAAFRTGQEPANGRTSLSGTPLCMAPELFRGEEASKASDIYSLGVLLYRLVSGRFPVEAKSIEELHKRHSRGDSVPLLDARPDLPVAFVQVVETALQATPRERYASAGEMERALAASLGRPVEPEPSPPRPWWRQRPLLWAAAASIALAVVGAITLWNLLLGPLEVEASLFRMSDGREERLLPGSRVALGDMLFLEIEGSKSMHVYVLNEDEAGKAFVLFPLPGITEQNPLSSNVRHRLPGQVAGIGTNWEVSSVGGEESFLVFASKRPLEELERQIAGLPRAGSAGAVSIGEETIDVLRGIGGLAESPSQETSVRHQRLSDMFAKTAGPSTSKSGIWIWHIRLSNPEETGETP
jgi:serine/threonine protein kinase